MRAYKRLSAVERAFRSLKTVDLKVRPVFHYTAGRVRAHVLLCMLAYYVEWHMRGWLKPLLFDDEDPAAAEAARASPVAPAKVSESAQAKGPEQTNRKRPAGPQLPDAARRPGDRRQEPSGPAPARRSAVHRDHPAYCATERSLPAAWSPPEAYPVTPLPDSIDLQVNQSLESCGGLEVQASGLSDCGHRRRDV